MRRNGLVAIAAAVTVLAGAAPAHAQSWKADIGILGGGSTYTSLLSPSAWDGSGSSVKYKGTWLLGSQLGFWFTPRIGIRAHGTYTNGGLTEGGGLFGEGNSIYDTDNLWSLSGDLLYRFKTPAPQMTHLEFLPYVTAGLGAKFHGAPGGMLVTQPDGTAFEGVPFFCGASVIPQSGHTGNCSGPGQGPGTDFFVANKTRLMGLVGLGGDLRLARNFALRLELGDRLYKPLVLQTTAPAVFVPAPALSTAISSSNVGKLVNEIYGEVGLQMLLGVAAPPVIAVTPTPAPPPPAPPPPPPPAPTTQNVSVCVVTPTAPTGLTSETAVYNPATGDTTIVVNGTATPLRSAFTGVTTASGATWYVQGQPLTIGTGRNALAYVSFGTPRSIDMGDLTYVGTVNGLPVFANRSDVASLTIPAPPSEIGTTPALVTGLRNVQVLYVPLTSYGCNFQPIQLQQQVRKVRG